MKPYRTSADLRGPVIALLVCVLSPLLAEQIALTPDAVVDRGLAALVSLQTPEGAIGEGAGITGLAGMALLAGGHTPTRGRYREASAKALRYVISSQDAMTGYLGGGFGNMYAHGFATLYLAECYGMSPNPQLKTALASAIDLIHRSQNSEGGWRYTPAPIDADISVTICQIMAIRAANNVGIGTDKNAKVMERALGYVRRCANTDGSFNYTIGSGSGWGTKEAEGIPRCAAGTMSLIGAGIYDTSDPVLGPSLRFLNRHVEAHLQSEGNWYWYGQYYSAQALFHSPDPQDWDRYWSRAWKTMAALQNSDGTWTRPESYGAAYATSMALIILQIPNNYLPIFQR